MTDKHAGTGSSGADQDPAADPWLRWAELDPLFEAALDLPVAERDAFAVRCCGDDRELLDRLRRLLRSADIGDDRLSAPGASLVRAALAGDRGEVGGHARETADPERGRLIGRYRLGDVLGRGGMATVYDAERADGVVEQRVAIKLIHRGLDTDEVVRRFVGERQILSGLEHPHIARLIDAGATADGRPYLVMERVVGEPIDDWSARRQAGVTSRLQLFLQVADAVRFAHSRLIVHRDLKPSNILIDDAGNAKLLDFGIAKLLDPDADDSLTRTGVRPHTPAYASPEQVRGDPVTTSSDVYQLGALLYVLLTGRRPFMEHGADLEAAITTGRIPRPSDVAATPPSMRTLRGDLDAIVMKAMRTEPERRYASVAELADDIRRYLAREPVLARPDSMSYRIRRFAARRPAVVAIALLLVAAATVYVLLLQRHASRLAVERDRAEVESQKAQQVTAFVTQLFSANDPDISAGEMPSAFDLLERGESRLDALASEPEVQAELANVIASMYTHLGIYDRAEPLFRQALELRRALDPVPLVDLAITLDQLGDVLQRTSRFDEAELLLRESIETARLGGDRRIEADAHVDLGNTLRERGDYAGAEVEYRTALAIRTAVLGELHERTGMTYNNLGVVLEFMERYDEAEAAFLRALEIKRATLDPQHTWIALSLTTLARLYSAQDDHDRALPLLEEALEIYRARLGPGHVSLALPINQLGFIAARRGEYVQAETHFREALAINEAAYGPVHQEVATSLNNLSYVLIEQARLEEALPLRRRVVDIAAATIGEDHANTGLFEHNLAVLLDRLGHHAEAAEMFGHAALHLGRTLPADHPLGTRPITGLGRLLLRTGRAAEAEQHLREALDRAVRWGQDAGEIGVAESLLGEALAALGRLPEAEQLLESGYAAVERAYGPDDDQARAARDRLDRVRRSPPISRSRS
jgi:eukaryotic-like serine/threonine-protein kinase